MRELTAERLRELLAYDPETGVFRWKASRGYVKGGKIAGTLNNRGRRQITVDRRLYVASRLAWLYQTGEWPCDQIDHINLIIDDNRFCNLREATNSQNQANTHKRASNKSGFKGVCSDRGVGWRAQIMVGGKVRRLGLFTTPERAFIAYIFAAWKHFGDFANIDADYLVAMRKRRARKAFEHSVLRNLANLSIYGSAA